MTTPKIATEPNLTYMWPPYLVDIWTAIHFLGWLLFTWFLLRVGVRCAIVALLVSMLGVGWEFLEPLTVEKILHFQEPWYNRWVTDLLSDFLGAAVPLYFTKIHKITIKVK